MNEENCSLVWENTEQHCKLMEPNTAPLKQNWTQETEAKKKQGEKYKKTTTTLLKFLTTTKKANYISALFLSSGFVLKIFVKVFALHQKTTLLQLKPIKQPWTEKKWEKEEE